VGPSLGFGKPLIFHVNRWLRIGTMLSEGVGRAVHTTLEFAADSDRERR